MTGTKRAVIAAMAISYLGGLSTLWAEARFNPYLTITNRNPFGIKDPPPPTSNEPPPPVIPLAKVLLTGVLNLGGTPRALLEITENEPGKAPTVSKRTLKEGERDGSIEVLTIDVANSKVKIRNGTIETNIAFEVAKTPATPPGPGPAAFAPAPGQFVPPVPGAHAMPGGAAAASPLTLSPNGINSARSGLGVSTFGAAPATPAATTPGTAVPSPSPNPYPTYPPAPSPIAPPALNTYGATANSPNSGVSTYGGSGNTTIPLRQPRAFPNLPTAPAK